MKKVLMEAMLVAAVGTVMAFAANELSPWGLALRRDFFPEGPKGSLVKGTAPGMARGADGTNQPSTDQTVAAQLKAKGLQTVDGDQAAQLFRDPRYQQELIVFVDARDDEHYQAGHIPGAYQFDRYHPEKYIA